MKLTTTRLSSYKASGYPRSPIRKISMKNHTVFKIQKHLQEVSNQPQRVKPYHSSLNIKQNDKKIFYPYSSYSLCYFDKKFQRKSISRVQKLKDLNSTVQIRTFINSKVKTKNSTKQSQKSQIIDPKQLNMKKKMQYLKQVENLRIQSSMIKPTTSPVSNSSKNPSNQKSLKFFRIKSIKPQPICNFDKYTHYNFSTNGNTQKQQIDLEGQFDLKYRSKTEQNPLGDLTMKRKSIQMTIPRSKKNQMVDPWEAIQEVNMENSIKLYMNQ